MKTRMEIWKNYRKEINNNIKLQEAVKTSNEKLALLNKRLLKVFPSYEKKFKFKFIRNNQNPINEINEIPHFPINEIDDLLKKVKQASLFSNSFKSIDEMDFSSHEVDDVIKEIKERVAFLEYNNLKVSEMGIVMGKIVLKNINDKKGQKIQIAIDGPSGSGKSTVAKLLAKKYNLKYINTGLVYRSIALNAIEKKSNLNNEDDILLMLKDDMIELLDNEKVILNGIDVSSQLRTNEVSQASSKISIHKKVRQFATNLQKKYIQQEKIIMDGRDTTFNIMPHANIKIFLETSSEERARRRSNENRAKGLDYDFKKILKEIKERDYRDRNRKVDPLHRTEDAFLINATKLSIKKVVEKISKIVERKLQNE